MHSCTNRQSDRFPGLLRRGLVAWVLLLGAGLGQVAAQEAQPPLQPAPAQPTLELQVQRNAQGVFLSALVPLQLPPAVQDALLKGIAMHFIAQVQIVQQRWYWSDKVQVQAMRYLRLAYQPLTRGWRVSQSSEPIASSGLGMALAQSYDSLDDALGAMQRIARWQVAEASQLQEGTLYILRLRYRLDTSQLPRPLQWGAVGGVNWSLQVQGSAPVPELPPPVEAEVPKP